MTAENPLVPFPDMQAIREALDAGRGTEEYVVVRRDSLERTYESTKNLVEGMVFPSDMKSDIQKLIEDIVEGVDTAIMFGEGFVGADYAEEIDTAVVDNETLENYKKQGKSLSEILGRISLISAKATLFDKLIGQDLTDAIELRDISQQTAERLKSADKTQEEFEAMRDSLSETIESKEKDAAIIRTLSTSVAGLDRVIKERR